MALTALAIDMLLPAFPELRSGLGLEADSSEISRTISVFFLGIATGQIFYGPFADRFGRKPVLYVGMSIYAAGSIAAALSPSLGVLLASRFLWGLGAAGSRVIAGSIVRDRYEGEQMARAMSFIMVVFITVPMIAPFLGELILAIANWRWIFWSSAIIVALVAVWSIRLPETLLVEDRRDLSFTRISEAGRLILGSRRALGHTLAMAGLFGVFASYLGSSKIIVDEVFGLEDRFALIFGVAALLFGVSALFNARLVVRYGLHRHSRNILRGFLVSSILSLGVALATDGTPTAWQFFPIYGLVLFFYAPLIPNFISLTMEPMGKLAGTATAVIGTSTMAVGAIIGAQIDAAFDGTVRPLTISFVAGAIWATLAVAWAQREVASVEEGSLEPAS